MIVRADQALELRGIHGVCSDTLSSLGLAIVCHLGILGRDLSREAQLELGDAVLFVFQLIADCDELRCLLFDLLFIFVPLGQHLALQLSEVHLKAVTGDLELDVLLLELL